MMIFKIQLDAPNHPFFPEESFSILSLQLYLFSLSSITSFHQFMKGLINLLLDTRFILCSNDRCVSLISEETWMFCIYLFYTNYVFFFFQSHHFQREEKVQLGKSYGVCHYVCLKIILQTSKQTNKKTQHSTGH